MKKLILSLGIVFGVFVALGSVSAASEDDLQPAEGIGPTYSPVYASYIYNNGVSYLRGTIINNSEVTMDGTDRMRVGNFPVTIGDDLRVNGRIDRMGLGGSPVIIADNLQVDGEITNGSGNVKLADTLQPVASDTYDLGTNSNQWRDIHINGEITNGSGNVKLADTLQPVASDTYDLGTDSNRWRDGYFGGKLIVGGMNEEGCNNREGILCVGNNDYNTVIYRDGRIRTDGIEVFPPDDNPGISVAGQINSEYLHVYEYIYANNINIEDSITLGNSGGLVGDEGAYGGGSICSDDRGDYEDNACDDILALNLDSITNTKPRSSAPYACTDDHKGDMIFSTTAIGEQGHANRYYYCASTEEGWLQLY